MGSAIIPEVEIAIERRANDPAKLINMKTHLFQENRETEVIVAQKLDMEIRKSTPK